MNIIYEIHTFVDEIGRNVIEKVPAISKDATKQTPTIREGIFAFKTPMGTMKASFIFPDTLNLESCFEKFDEFAQIKANEIEKEIKSQIAVPNKGLAIPSQKNKGGIIIP